MVPHQCSLSPFIQKSTRGEKRCAWRLSNARLLLESGEDLLTVVVGHPRTLAGTGHAGLHAPGVHAIWTPRTSVELPAPVAAEEQRQILQAAEQEACAAAIIDASGEHHVGVEALVATARDAALRSRPDRPGPRVAVAARGLTKSAYTVTLTGRGSLRTVPHTELLAALQPGGLHLGRSAPRRAVRP
jgi:hypothetical protein